MFISQPALLKNETREIKLNINSLKKKKKHFNQKTTVKWDKQQSKEGKDYVFVLILFKTKKKKTS